MRIGFLLRGGSDRIDPSPYGILIHDTRSWTGQWEAQPVLPEYPQRAVPGKLHAAEVIP